LKKEGDWNVKNDATCASSLPLWYDHMRMFAGYPADQQLAYLNDFCGDDAAAAAAAAAGGGGPVTCGKTYTMALQGERMQCPTPPAKSPATPSPTPPPSSPPADQPPPAIPEETRKPPVVHPLPPTDPLPPPPVATDGNGDIVVPPAAAAAAVAAANANGAASAPLDKTPGTVETPNGLQAVSLKEGGKEGWREAGKKEKGKGKEKGKEKEEEVVTNELRSKPYPSDYPGLRLGCVREGGGKTQGGYCAMKRAVLAGAPAAVGAAGGGGGSVCDFYLSCCYAQYAKMNWTDLPNAEVVEAHCPGATVYLNGKLCTV